MKLDHLKAFHRVALTGSFTKAASSLHLSQSAVSQQIQLLEHSLGITLFDRQRKNVQLTNEGEALLSYTDRLFNLYEEILTHFASQQSLEHGKIAIGSSNVIGTYYLPKIISLYNNQYPGIEIDLRLGNSNYVLGKILEGAVDIGIAGKTRNHPKLSEHFIHSERLLPVSSPEHDLVKEQSVGVNELAKMPFISREKGTLTRLIVEKWFKENLGKNYPKIAIELENVEAAKQIVQQGYGYTIIPESTVEREIKTGLLKQINVQNLDLYIHIYVVYLKGKVFPKAVKTFLEILSGSHIFSNTEDLLDRIFSG